MVKMTDAERAARNQRPHAEARLAMAMWSREYAYEQNGGSMDFWDGLDAQRKRLCVDVVTAVLDALEKNGRSTQPGESK
jgi:hypothetical protein